MANIESGRKEDQTGSQSQERGTEERGSSNAPARRYQGSPQTLMRRLSDDMDRLFGEFFGSRTLGNRTSVFGETTRWPEIEAFQRGDKFLIRADVPGLNKDDIRVEVLDNVLCISGERRSETERNEGDYYARERSYGSFCRTIALPAGAKTESASASFDKGVLQIEIEVPTQSARSRRIEVREQPAH
jgi:HSP20 family protein